MSNEIWVDKALTWVLFYKPLMWNMCAMKVMIRESTENREDIMLISRENTIV